MLVNAKEYEPAFAPYLFITGACAGAFPQSVDDTDIITGQDIAQMKIRIEPTAQLQSARMWQHAINIIESAKINVYFSYSLKNISGESVSASPLLNGTAELEVELYSKQFAKQQTLLNIGNKSAFKNNETAEYYASIKTAADLDNIRIPQISKQPRDISNPEKLFFKKGHTSVTAVENYAKCPYYGYLVNALELKPNAPKNTVPPNIIGTILHTFAEKGDIKSILKNYNLPKYLERVICKQCAEIKKYLESNTIEFKPKFFEYEISGVIDGKTIRGKADRIDTDDKGHFVVVDYKTGDPGVVRLQLPLYMHFLNEKMGLEPLGGYYLNLRKFKKIDIEPAEIPLAIEKTQEVLSGMCAGKIIKQPIHKSVCQYCPCGALCGVHND
jgi:ATP-dependent helicase/DNAse subunit B